SGGDDSLDRHLAVETLRPRLLGQPDLRHPSARQLAQQQVPAEVETRFPCFSAHRPRHMLREVMRTLLCLLLLGADGSVELGRAQEHARTMDFPAALKDLAAATGAEGASRDTLCEAYELQGVIQATLKQEPAAVESFK